MAKTRNTFCSHLNYFQSQEVQGSVAAPRYHCRSRILFFQVIPQGHLLIQCGYQSSSYYVYIEGQKEEPDGKIKLLFLPTESTSNFKPTSYSTFYSLRNIIIWSWLRKGSLGNKITYWNIIEVLFKKKEKGGTDCNYASSLHYICPLSSASTTTPFILTSYNQHLNILNSLLS